MSNKTSGNATAVQHAADTTTQQLQVEQTTSGAVRTQPIAFRLLLFFAVVVVLLLVDSSSG
jgi:hypothetical protein